MRQASSALGTLFALALLAPTCGDASYSGPTSFDMKDHPIAALPAVLRAIQTLDEHHRSGSVKWISVTEAGDRWLVSLESDIVLMEPRLVEVDRQGELILYWP